MNLADDRPTYNQLLHFQKADGSNLKVIQWITALEQWRCIDFAHVLLKDGVLVSKYNTECKEKDEFVRKVLNDWLSWNDNDPNDLAAPRTWAALAECVTDAGLPGTLAKAIRDTFPSGLSQFSYWCRAHFHNLNSHSMYRSSITSKRLENVSFMSLPRLEQSSS